MSSTNFISTYLLPLVTRSSRGYLLQRTLLPVTGLLFIGISGCISISLPPPPPAPVYSLFQVHSQTLSKAAGSEPHPAHGRADTRATARQLYKTPYHSILELRFKTGERDSVRAGSIFAGVLVPVGSITVLYPSLHLESALREQLLQESTQIISTTKAEMPEITINTLSLTVWDLLVTRKISCDLMSTITPAGQENEDLTRQFKVHYSAYTMYAFERELAFYLRECFDLLAQRILAGIKPEK